MPAPPYYSALPLDGSGRRYVDQSAWDSVIGAFYAWPDNVNANNKNLSNLGVLTFGAGGHISGDLPIDAGAVAISGAGSDPGAAVGLWLKNDAPSGYPTSLAGYSIQLLTGANSARVPRVTIDNGGNVGIGTASPVSVGHLYGAPAAPSLLADSGLLTLGFSNNAQLAFGNYGSSPYALWIQTKYSLNNGEKLPLAINPLGGQVGIGTDVACAAILALNCGDVTRRPLFLRNEAGSGWAIRNDAAVFSLVYENDAGAALATPALKTTWDGYLVFTVKQAAVGTDFQNLNGTGQIYVDEAGKKAYLQYRTTGGTLKQIELGSYA